MNSEPDLWLRQAITAELGKYGPESRGPSAKDLWAPRAPSYKVSQVRAELQGMEIEGLVRGRKIHGVIRWVLTAKGRRPARPRPGETRILAYGTHEGVNWVEYERCPPGVFTVFHAFTVWYQPEPGGPWYQSDTLARGRTGEEVAAEWKADRDQLPARIARSEQVQADGIRETARIELGRYREEQRLNPLGYSGACQAWETAHGRRPPQSLIIRWARSGVSQAEHDSDWYQAALARRP